MPATIEVFMPLIQKWITFILELHKQREDEKIKHFIEIEPVGRFKEELKSLKDGKELTRVFCITYFKITESIYRNLIKVSVDNNVSHNFLHLSLLIVANDLGFYIMNILLEEYCTPDEVKMKALTDGMYHDTQRMILAKKEIFQKHISIFEMVLNSKPDQLK